MIQIRICITHSSTAKQEEKQEERGSCQTLVAIKNKEKSKTKKRGKK